MRYGMHRLTALFLLLLPMVAAQGQDLLAEDEQEEIRRFTVEMIIFKYAQEVSTGSEIFVADEVVADEALLEELPGEDEIPLLRDEPQEPDEETLVLRDVEFVPLGKDEFTLGETMGRLERLEVYDPVLHFGWTQATWPQEETQAIQLASLTRPPQGLDGTLTLYLSRYLHLVVNLQLDGPKTATRYAAARDSMSAYGDYRTLDGFAEETQPGVVHYRIEEDRIFRSGELRYFDHPKFGVLAKITRVEEEEPPETDDQGEVELLGYPAE